MTTSGAERDAHDPTELSVLARAETARGEVVLRRRGLGELTVWELIVNGAFAMDSAETSSERALATLPVRYDGTHILLGGLGLGYTAAALLETGATSIEVAELEPALITWAREGRTEVLARVAGDARVRLVAADVAAVLTASEHGPWDLILLDVDNGPDFLIHDDNAALYGADGLARAVSRLRPGGTLAIWCQGAHAALRTALESLGRTDTHTYEVQRGRRRFAYVIYTVQPQPSPSFIAP